MTVKSDTKEIVKDLQHKKKRAGIGWIVTSAMLGTLTCAVFVLFDNDDEAARATEQRQQVVDSQFDQAANRIAGLELALTAQRAQFEKCKDKKPGAAGCTRAVSPEPSSVVGPRGTPGDAGEDGTTGTAGRDGAVGSAGRDGVNGSNGLDGAAGEPGADGAAGSPGPNGTNGSDGTPGANGNDGAAGSNGNDGQNGLDGKDGAQGIAGPPGQQGEQGERGESAYPFTFRFVIPGDLTSPERTVTCTVTSASDYTCS